MKKPSWWDKPITWGSSLTMSLGAMALSAVVTGVWYAINYVDWDACKALATNEISAMKKIFGRRTSV